MGYELVGVQLLNAGKHGKTLRIYIDHADGITLDDCAAVSHQFSGVLDVEDPVSGNYDLEVSSPGWTGRCLSPSTSRASRGSR